MEQDPTPVPADMSPDDDDPKAAPHSDYVGEGGDGTDPSLPLTAAEAPVPAPDAPAEPDEETGV